jgi:hypothetical protein
MQQAQAHKAAMAAAGAEGINYYEPGLIPPIIIQ